MILEVRFTISSEFISNKIAKLLVITYYEHPFSYRNLIIGGDQDFLAKMEGGGGGGVSQYRGGCL